MESSPAESSSLQPMKTIASNETVNQPNETKENHGEAIKSYYFETETKRLKSYYLDHQS
jgi:hypothetical protein